MGVFKINNQLIKVQFIFKEKYRGVKILKGINEKMIKAEIKKLNIKINQYK